MPIHRIDDTRKAYQDGVPQFGAKPSIEKCGDRCDGLTCDREPDHPGTHRGYNTQIDEPMFWSRRDRNV